MNGKGQAHFPDPKVAPGRRCGHCSHFPLNAAGKVPPKERCRKAAEFCAGQRRQALAISRDCVPCKYFAGRADAADWQH